MNQILPDVNSLIEKLSTKHPDEVIGELTRIGAPAVDSLIPVLNGERKVRSDEVRRLAPWGLEGLEAQAANDKWVRVYAAKALGRIGDARAVKALGDSLYDSDWLLRDEAARALGACGPEGVATLLRTLRDKTCKGRDSSAKALGEARETSAVDALNRALTEPELCVSAAEALGKIGDPRAVPAFIRALRHNRRRRRGPKWKWNWDVCAFEVRVAEAFGVIKDITAFEPLISIIEGGSKEAQVAAANALGKLGDPRAVPVLLSLLPSGVRNPLVSPGKTRLFPRLITAIRHRKDTHSVARSNSSAEAEWGGDPELARAALASLAEIGDISVIEPLVRVIVRTGALRYEIAETLVKFGNAAVAPLVRQIDHISGGVRAALIQLGGSAVESLIGALGDNSRRSNAACLLGEIGDRRAVEPLIRSLAPACGSEVISALGKLGDARAVEPLVRLLDAGCRLDVISALEKLGDARGAILPMVMEMKSAERECAEFESAEAVEWAEKIEPVLRRILASKSGAVAPDDLRLLGTLQDTYDYRYMNGYKKIDFSEVKQLAREQLNLHQRQDLGT